ncbi:MAG: GNAT family N-acetyltransferase [Acidobacteriota bacterium]
MPFTLRPALPTDTAALAELAARTFRETFASDNRPEDMVAHEAESYGPAQQGREIADPNIVTILVHAPDENGALVGFSQVRRGSAPACVTDAAPVEVWRFYIAKEHHGKGIAQALMARVHTDAREMGARTLWLGVWERNERAKTFYRKCGFIDVGTHVYVVGTDAQTDRIMVREVDTPNHSSGASE